MTCEDGYREVDDAMHCVDLGNMSALKMQAECACFCDRMTSSWT